MHSDKDWIDKLDDAQFKTLFKKLDQMEELPVHIDEKLKNLIRNQETLKKKKTNIPNFFLFNPVFKYAVSFSLFFLIIISSLFVYFRYLIPNKNLDICRVTHIEGDAYKIINENKKRKLSKNDSIRQQEIIVTGEESKVDLQVGEKYFLRVNKDSKIKVIKLFKDKVMEDTKFKLEIGEVFAKTDELYPGSIFEIQTESMNVRIKGTEFVVSVSDDKVKVEVKRGQVFVQTKMFQKEIEEIKAVDPGVADKVISIINKEIVLLKNQKIEVPYDSIKKLEEEIGNTIISLKEEIINNKTNTSKIDEILNKYESKIDILNETFKSYITEEDWNTTDKVSEKDIDELFSVSLINNNLNIKQIEKNTAITHDNANIYVASDFNKSIYCIDLLNGELKWNFKNNELKKITTPVINFKNELVVSSPVNIFVLNNKGELLKIYKIQKGPSYWDFPIITDNKLFIAGSENVYIYNGKEFSILKELPKAMGQLYIQDFLDNLFFVYSNEKIIRLYNIKKNKIIWQSNNLNERIFSKPLITDKYILIGDISKNIYKFNYLHDGNPVSKLSIGKGIVSNIILKNNYLYFVANNGYFCRLNIDNFNLYSEIVKIENKPDINKFLTKKIILVNDDIYFSSDNGKLFNYNIIKGDYYFVDVSSNPLIGSPIVEENNICVVDNKTNIYKIIKKNK